MPKPWTASKVLQSFFFTNPYRENDKVTVWFRENIREPMRDDPRVIFATICFRWFNLPKTGEMLIGSGIGKKDCLLTNWQETRAVKELQHLNKEGPVFTGAFMVKAGNGPPGCKIPNVCRSMTEVWNDRDNLLSVIKRDVRIERMVSEICRYPNLGNFLGYEVASDLRWTWVLENASDILTWANPGPGAMRGLNRLEGGKPGLDHRGFIIRHTYVEDPIGKMNKLMDILNKRLKFMPKFEMREAEHICCEFDKYERALWEDGGRMKRRYPGGA